MTKATKKSGGWNTVRQKLTAWNNPALLDLLKNPPQSPFTKGGRRNRVKIVLFLPLITSPKYW